MTIEEFLTKYGLAVPEDKAKEFAKEFAIEFKPASDFDAKAQELAARDTELNGLREQVKERDKDIKALKEQTKSNEELSGKLAELQTKYETDTQTLTQQLETQKMDFAVEKFFAPVPFASELARKAAVAEFREKGFKLDNGKFQGGEEFLEELKKNDPAAFKQETSEQPSEGLPQFTKPMNQPPPASDATPFAFQFSNFVRQPPNAAKNQ